MPNLQENALNLRLTMTIKENGVVKDVSGASTQQFIFYKPNQSSQTVTSSFDTTGTDGKIVYTTSSGFLTPAGIWEVQARIILSSSSYDGRTNVVSFVVDANLP